MDKNLNDHPMMEAIRENVNLAVDRVQDLEILELAKEKVSDTKNQVLSVFNVPSQGDVDNLTKKLAALEKKVKTINKKTAK